MQSRQRGLAEATSGRVMTTHPWFVACTESDGHGWFDLSRVPLRSGGQGPINNVAAALAAFRRRLDEVEGRRLALNRDSAMQSNCG